MNTLSPYQKRIGLLEGGCNGGLSILVTMCGKSVDLLWLCERGHSVIGIEISPIAVGQLFTDNSIPVTITGVCVCVCARAFAFSFTCVGRGSVHGYITVTNASK